MYWRRFEDALAEFEQALSLNPNFSLAQAYYGLVLSYVGRWEDGANAARRALRLSPRDPFSAICSGVAAYAEFVGGNYHEAMRLAREGDPSAPRLRRRLPCAHRGRRHGGRDVDSPRPSLQELRRAQPNISLAWIAEHLPMRPGQREVFLEAMRRAGLD